MESIDKTKYYSARDDIDPCLDDQYEDPSAASQPRLQGILRIALLVFISVFAAINLAVYFILQQLIAVLNYVKFDKDERISKEILKRSKTWKEFKKNKKIVDDIVRLKDSSFLLDLEPQKMTGDEKYDLEKAVMEASTTNLNEATSISIIKNLDFLVASTDLSLENKLEKFKALSSAFGKSAIDLSNLGVFGYFHLGVIKALFENNCLPTIINGTGSDSLMAAVLGTRTDTELQNFFLENNRVDVMSYYQMTRSVIRKTKDWNPYSLKTCLYLTNGNTTFLEAFKNTSRILNITLLGNEKKTSIVLNYVTAPNVTIISAVLASCTENSQKLCQKEKGGGVTPFNDFLCSPLDIPDWKHYFNVSQALPPFDSLLSSSKNNFKGALNIPIFALTAISHYCLLELWKFAVFLKDLNLLSASDVSFIGKDDTSTSVTIFLPRINLFGNPGSSQFQDTLKADGQKQTFYCIQEVKNRIDIEMSIEFHMAKAAMEIKLRPSDIQKRIETSLLKEYRLW